MASLNGDLARRLSRIRRPLTLRLVGPDGVSRQAIREVWEGIVPETVTIREETGIPLHMTLHDAEQPLGVRFWGIPGGFVLESVVYALEVLGDLRPPLHDFQAESVLSALPATLSLELYVGAT